ncbi:MAG: hypothetical protein IJ272_01360 [Clostridia bacterium]|nr:hypothetical protein [Clostridia bacterium]
MKKVGMSLITLVITVIVMIIVASVTIMSLNNTGIIEKAESAVEDMNLKNIQQLANMAYANIYFDNLTQGIRQTITAEEICERMLKDGTKQEELDKYEITVENGDVFVSLKGEE